MWSCMLSVNKAADKSQKIQSRSRLGRRNRECRTTEEEETKWRTRTGRVMMSIQAEAKRVNT